MKIFFRYILLRESGKHKTVVILLFRELIFKTNYLEALSTNLASVNWTFSAHIEHLFVSVRIILNTRTSADYDSP
jgi:hypothetical protein